VGGTVAAWLAQDANHRVTLCARTRFDELRVETPVGVLTAQPDVLVDAAAAVPVDWVLVATKVYDIAATGAWLRQLVGPQTRVAVLQNGVEQVARFAPLVPVQQIVPAVVDIPAGRTAPGRMVQRRLGSIVVPAGSDGEAFAELFQGAQIGSARIEVTAVPDWVSRAWAKLCVNCAGALTTLTLRATGPVWNAALEALIGGLVAECAAVGRAEGAVIGDEVIAAVIDGARRAPEGTFNSMADDRLAGRPMEIDARNGVIVRLGRAHGIPTPINQMMVTLLEASGSPWVQAQ
jgi:2-dehydropantoate 2-reductase